MDKNILIKETIIIAVITILFLLGAIGVFFFYNAPLIFKISAGIAYVGLGIFAMWGYIEDIIEQWKKFKKEK